MISNQQVEGLMAGAGNVLGPHGDKIGAVGTFYLDDQTNEPAWVTVNTGLFGTHDSFVPLTEATVDGVDVLVPYSKEEVKNSPQVEADGSITPEEEVTLYRYYGFTYDDDAAGTPGKTDTAPTTAAAGEEDDVTRTGVQDERSASGTPEANDPGTTRDSGS